MSEKLIYADNLIQFVKHWGEIRGREEAADSFLYAINNASAVDAVEVVRKEAVDFSYLADWYIRSVTNDPPVWTEEHIEELFNDFYLVPKGERREKNAVD